MTPPPWWHADWRAWIYAIAWLGGGAALTVMSIWQIRIIAYGDWSAGSDEQRLNILGTALYMSLSAPLLVMLGLGLRNAIRNIKGSVGAASFEASGHDGGAAE